MTVLAAVFGVQSLHARCRTAAPLSISRTLRFWRRCAPSGREPRLLPVLPVAGLRRRPGVDVRASIPFLFGVFIFVKCFIIFLWAWNCRNLRNLPLDSVSCWSKQKIIDLTSSCGEITGCPSVCSPFGISANTGCSHWSLLAYHAPGYVFALKSLFLFLNNN